MSAGDDGRGDARSTGLAMQILLEQDVPCARCRERAQFVAADDSLVCAFHYQVSRADRLAAQLKADRAWMQRR